MTHHGASNFLKNLALITLAHSLPAMDVSPGNQSPGMAWLSEWGCAYLLILINNRWPWLLDELLLQPQWEYTGTTTTKKKCEFKPICPLGSIIEFHIGIGKKLNSSLSLESHTRHRLQRHCPCNGILFSLHWIALHWIVSVQYPVYFFPHQLLALFSTTLHMVQRKV